MRKRGKTALVFESSARPTGVQEWKKMIVTASKVQEYFTARTPKWRMGIVTQSLVSHGTQLARAGVRIALAVPKQRPQHLTTHRLSPHNQFLQLRNGRCCRWDEIASFIYECNRRTAQWQSLPPNGRPANGPS